MKDFSNHYEKKAEELKKLKKFEEALMFTDKAKKIKEEELSEDFWYKKAVNCQEFEAYDDALECLEKELLIHKASFKTHFLQGQILVQLKKYAEAIEYFNKASEEKNQKFLHNRKKVERMKDAHKFEKALIYQDSAVNGKQIDCDFWHYKGIAFLKLKKYENAKECFMNSLEIKEDTPKILYDLAKCELLLGNEEKCLHILKKSFNSNSSYKEKIKKDYDFSQLFDNKKLNDILDF